MIRRVLLVAIGATLLGVCMASRSLEGSDAPSLPAASSGGPSASVDDEDDERSRRPSIVHLLTGDKPHKVDGSLWLQLGEVQDSRCPMGVMCIQAGGVVATVLVNETGSASTLVLSSMPGAAVNVTTSKLGYVLQLRSVLPPPAKPAGKLRTEQKDQAAVLYDLEVAVFAPPRRQAQLNKARARWSAAVNGSSPGGYSMVEQLSCFCPEQILRPVRMVVDGHGNITSAMYVQEGGGPVPSEFLGSSFYSVEGLFDIIQDAIHRNAAIIKVHYNESYGYPTSLFIDLSPMIADEERSFTVTELALAPPPPHAS